MKNYSEEFESQTKLTNLRVQTSVDRSAPLVEPSNLHALRLDKLLLKIKVTS